MGIMTTKEFSTLISSLEQDHDPNCEGKTTEEIRILTAIENYLLRHQLDTVDVEWTLNFDGGSKMRFKDLVIEEGDEDDAELYYVSRKE